MNCTDRTIKELIPLSLEQVLDQHGQERLESHLTTCKDCRDELALLRTMAAEQVPDPGEAFWNAMPARVWREMKHEQARPKPSLFRPLLRFFSPPRLAWAAASAMIAAVLALTLLSPLPGEFTVAGGPAPEVLDYFAPEEPVDLAALTQPEAETIESWADQELAEITAGAAEVMLSGMDRSVAEELVDLDSAALERFSRMLDDLPKEG